MQVRSLAHIADGVPELALLGAEFCWGAPNGSGAGGGREQGRVAMVLQLSQHYALLPSLRFRSASCTLVLHKTIYKF